MFIRNLSKRKLSIFVLLMTFSFVLTGCSLFSKTELEKHLDTIEKADTFTIEVSSKIKINNQEVEVTQYLFVDNVNKIIKATSIKDNIERVFSSAMYYEYNDGDYYCYYKDESDWIRIDVIDENAGISIEEAFVIIFNEEDIFPDNTDIIVHKKSLTINELLELSEEVAELFIDEIDSEYYNIKIDIKSIYSIDDEMYLEFNINLSDILIQIYDDLGIDVISDDTEWEIIISYHSLDLKYEINLPSTNIIIDDHINSLLDIQTVPVQLLDSNEMFNGIINYSEDKDIFIVEISDSGNYGLNLASIDTSDSLRYEIFNTEFDMLHEGFLTSETPLTEDYYFYVGEVYLVIYSYTYTEETSYSITFIK